MNVAAGLVGFAVALFGVAVSYVVQDEGRGDGPHAAQIFWCLAGSAACAAAAVMFASGEWTL